MRLICLILIVFALSGCSKESFTTDYVGRDFTKAEVDESVKYFNIGRGDSWTRVVINIMNKFKEIESKL